MDTHYLNTDLDVVSTGDEAGFVAAMEARGATLIATEHDDDTWRAIFEVNLEAVGDPDATINALLDVVAGLDGDARATWDGAQLRELNVGYDCGEQPWAFSQALTPATLARIAGAGVALRWTLYPAERAPAPA